MVKENTNEMSDMSNYMARVNNDPLRGLQLAMAYVPWQKFENLYTGDVALARGTMFKGLDFPLLREEVTPRE